MYVYITQRRTVRYIYTCMYLIDLSDTYMYITKERTDRYIHVYKQLPSKVVIIILFYCSHRMTNVYYKWVSSLSRRSGMERLVEDLIQESMSKGEFDDLPGKGKPLSSPQDQNPMVDTLTFNLNKIVIDQGFAPEWVRLSKDSR